MLQISTATRLMCGISLISVPARDPGYVDSLIRQNLFRAGHERPKSAAQLKEI